MWLVLGADDAAADGGLSVMGTKMHFTLLAAKAVCVPYAQRGEGAALWYDILDTSVGEDADGSQD